MKKMILLFSHKLNESQITDAKASFGITEFLYLPEELQKSWSDISPELISLDEMLAPVREFVGANAKAGDVILIQGDFGAVYSMVNFAKQKGLNAVYATTKRVVTEIIEDGKTEKKSIFEHRRFREYE